MSPQEKVETLFQYGLKFNFIYIFHIRRINNFNQIPQIRSNIFHS